jgi:ribosomal protein S12 methylthiotransferase accessory factor
VLSQPAGSALFFRPRDQPAPLDGDAVGFRGSALRGVKRFWRGTQRSVSPAETLEWVRPHFKTAGITRLADITGLDRIGIPTTLAIRPNSKTLSNSSGKGFSLEAAMASGAMEAIELFHAEECDLASFQLSYEQLGKSYSRIPTSGLALTKDALFNDRWPYTWTLGWDIMNQREVPVPLAMVHMALGHRRLRELHSFQLTSNGLASGNTMLEAINAGLFEVIERDAVTCHRLLWEETRQPPPVVRIDTIGHPLVQELLDRLTAASVEAVIFDCTVDTAVPVYMAYIYDLVLRHIGLFRGYGAHLDPEIAMVRAITEAVQSRAIYIAGSRDDVFRHGYQRLQRDDGARTLPTMKALTPTVDARDRVSAATPTFEGDTVRALCSLRQAGLPQAIVVDLSRPDFPINVVKVIVPGLEGYLFDFYAPGSRARAFVRRSRCESSRLPGPDASA